MRKFLVTGISVLVRSMTAAANAKSGSMLLLSACLLLFAASRVAFGGPIQNIDWDPTADDFILTVRFGAINADDTHNINQGGPWRVNITVNEFASTLLGIGQDRFSIIGSAQHQAGPNIPHTGDAAMGFPWPIDISFLAPFPAFDGTSTAFGGATRPHPAVGHSDVFSFDIIADVQKGGLFGPGFLGSSEITGWTLIMRGEHMESIPEPATVTLLGAIASILLWSNWRSRSRKRVNSSRIS